MKKLQPSPLAATIIFFVLALLVIVYQLRLVDANFSVDILYPWLRNLGDWRAQLTVVNHIGDALILLLPFCLLPPKWRGWQWLVMTLLTIWCICQVLYHAVYVDIMPYSSFTLVNNLDGQVTGSAGELFTRNHLKIILAPLALLVFYLLFLRKPIARHQCGLRRRLLVALACVIAFGVLQLATAAWDYRKSDKNDDGLYDYSSFPAYCRTAYTISPVRNDTYYLAHGWTAYTLWCAWAQIDSWRGLTDKKRQAIDDFLNERPQYADSTYYAHCENLVLIVVESLNAWAAGATIDDISVSPTLDSLAALPSTLVCRHMTAQVKSGRSSDARFIYNTGLLPLTDRSVAVFYADNTYPALCHALPQMREKMHIWADRPTYWNTGAMLSAMGYETVWGDDSLRANYGEAVDARDIDRYILSEATQTLPRLQQPFLLQIVTKGMHAPYDQPVNPQARIAQSQQYNAPIRNYLDKVATFDTALADFLRALRQSGLSDNTLVVIAADHTQDVEGDTTMLASPTDRGDCLLLICNAGAHREIARCGQVDVFPTLLDLMGANAYPWHGLGYSLMRGNGNAASPAPNVITPPGTTDSLRLQQAWDISRDIIQGNYFKP